MLNANFIDKVLERIRKYKYKYFGNLNQINIEVFLFALGVCWKYWHGCLLDNKSVFSYILFVIYLNKY